MLIANRGHCQHRVLAWGAHLTQVAPACRHRVCHPACHAAHANHTINRAMVWSKPAARHTRPVVCQSTAASVPAGADRFFKSTDRPVPVLGPIEVINSAGHGRGLGLTQVCEKGDLLMVSLPISLVYGSEEREEDAGLPGVRGGVGPAADVSGTDAAEEDEDYDKRFEALQSMMTQQRFTTPQARWLEALSGAAESRPPVPDLCIDHTKDRGQPLLPLPPPLASQPDIFETFLQTHTFEAEMEDQVLSSRAGEEPREQLLGVWPEHALLNHSCVPSTVSYVNKGALVTRVTRRSIPKGSELFTNYLGDLVMSPLDVRREALEDVWGFVCTCPRCKEEERLDKDIQQLITDVYEACTDQINEDLVDAIESQDNEALESLQNQLTAFVELISAACAKKRLSPRLVTYVEASLFCVYEALHHVVEERDARELNLTNKLQTLAGAMWPGSELHCYWSRVHLDAVLEAVESGQLLPNTGKTPKGGKGGSIVKPLAGDSRRGGKKGGFGGGRGGAGGVVVSVTPEAADENYFRALATRYGPISRAMYEQILKEDEEDEDEEA